MRGAVKPVGIASSERFQFELGRAQVMLDAARSQLHAACLQAFDVALSGEARSPQTLLPLQCSAIFATEVAAEVCQTLFRWGGAKSLYAGNPLEPCLRNVQAAGQHGLVNADNYSSLGQVALGFQEITPR